MSSNNSGWPAKPAIPAKPDGGLAPLALLAGEGQATERDPQGRFLTGNNGGGGRKIGSRNRLTETFLATVEADFAAYGANALAQVRMNEPSVYLKIVTSILPRELILAREQKPDFSDLTDSEISNYFGELNRTEQFSRMYRAITGDDKS